mgnify:FL=1
MTEGPYCPKCLTVTLMRSDRYAGADECPGCGAVYFGSFEASPERMAELRRARLSREHQRSTSVPGWVGLALAACGNVLLASSVPWPAVVGAMFLVVGWTAWKGRDL